MWQRVPKQISCTSTLSDPQQKQSQSVSMLRLHNGNIHQSIKRFSCQPCGQIFRKKCTMSFHIEIKQPDTNMPFPEWSCEICKEPYPHSRALKGHIKWVHKTKQNNFFFILCKIMYKKNIPKPGIQIVRNI